MRKITWITTSYLLALMLFGHLGFAETLNVYKITTSKGAISDQSLSVLDSLDQTGQDDDWSTYIEAAPNSSKFVGIFHFNQATNLEWQEMKINVNTIGEAIQSQRWIFQVKNFATRRWLTVGDNGPATAWTWTPQTFSISDNVEDYINARGDIKLRYVSNNAVDVSNIDLATIDLIEDEIIDPPDGELWQPTPDQNITWQWQINGNLDTSLDVDMYDVDLFDTSAETIAELKDAGRIVVCYFSAGTYEGWRSDWQEFFPFITGDSYEGTEPPFAGNMADWDERWLDISRIDLLEDIMRSRVQLAVEKGCDGVEPDNMDAYTNGSETGIPLTAQNQLDYNRFIANLAHENNISVGLKNDVAQLADLVDDFDWALNEQCFQYNECDGYSVFINAGKAVFGVEYNGSEETFCPLANAQKLYWLKKRLSLKSWRIGCEDFE